MYKTGFVFFSSLVDATLQRRNDITIIPRHWRGAFYVSGRLYHVNFSITLIHHQKMFDGNTFIF